MAGIGIVESNASAKPQGLLGQGQEILILPCELSTGSGLNAALPATMSPSDVNKISGYVSFLAQPGPNAKDRSKP